MAGVAGGLARYHAALGAPVESLRMLMPVNVRGGENADRAGNQFAPARFEVPVGIANPAERIRKQLPSRQEHPHVRPSTC